MVGLNFFPPPPLGRDCHHLLKKPSRQNKFTILRTIHNWSTNQEPINALIKEKEIKSVNTNRGKMQHLKIKPTDGRRRGRSDERRDGKDAAVSETDVRTR